MKATSPTVLAVAALAVAAAVPSRAHAGGIEVPDLGARALGRGAAFVARADDLSAFHYNPAGLSKSRGVNVHLGVNILHMNAAFERGGGDRWTCLPGGGAGCDTGEAFSGRVFAPANDPRGVDPTERGSTATGDPFDVVRNEKPISPLPLVVAQWGDVGGVDGLALAAGLTTPAAFGFPAYPARGSQRYALRSAEALVVYPGVGISWRIERWLSIGGVFMNGITHARFDQAARGTTNPENPEIRKENDGGDASFGIEVRDWSSPVGIVGVLSNPIDQLELGASVRTPVVIDARGDLTYESSEELAGRSGLVCAGFSPDDPSTDAATRWSCEGVAFRQRLPWVVRAGARYVHPRFDIEVDWVYEAWGGTGKGWEVDVCDAADDEAGARMCGAGGPIEVGIQNLGTVPVLDTTLLKRFRDTHSVRVGSDVVAVPGILDVRLGGWWQSSAYPADHSTFSVDFPVAQQISAGAGATWHAIARRRPRADRAPNHLDVTLGYARVFQPTVRVSRGVLQQQSIRDPTVPAGGNVVNDGIYRVSYNVFALALEGRF
jgi:long-subunit fatty acid transport protein